MGTTQVDVLAEMQKLEAVELALLVRAVATRRWKAERRRDAAEQPLVEGDQSRRWEVLRDAMDEFLGDLNS